VFARRGLTTVLLELKMEFVVGILLGENPSWLALLAGNRPTVRNKEVVNPIKSCCFIGVRFRGHKLEALTYSSFRQWSTCFADAFLFRNSLFRAELSNPSMSFFLRDQPLKGVNLLISRYPTLYKKDEFFSQREF
jgi:hypothetical protein